MTRPHILPSLALLAFGLLCSCGGGQAKYDTDTDSVETAARPKPTNPDVSDLADQITGQVNQPKEKDPAEEKKEEKKQEKEKDKEKEKEKTTAKEELKAEAIADSMAFESQPVHTPAPKATSQPEPATQPEEKEAE